MAQGLQESGARRKCERQVSRRSARRSLKFSCRGADAAENQPSRDEKRAAERPPARLVLYSGGTSGAQQPPIATPILHRLIGDASVVDAIRQTADRFAAAEKEVGRPGIADGPVARGIGELKNRAPLADRDNVVEQLRLRLDFGFGFEEGERVMGERGVAARGRARAGELRWRPRLARTRHRGGR